MAQLVEHMLGQRGAWVLAVATSPHGRAHGHMLSTDRPESAAWPGRVHVGIYMPGGAPHYLAAHAVQLDGALAVGGTSPLDAFTSLLSASSGHKPFEQSIHGAGGVG